MADHVIDRRESDLVLSRELDWSLAMQRVLARLLLRNSLWLNRLGRVGYLLS